jgi:hypothetical protein
VYIVLKRVRLGQVKDWDDTGEEQSIGKATIPFSSLEVIAACLSLPSCAWQIPCALPRC